LKNYKIIFITIGPVGYSRSWVYYSGLKDTIPNLSFIRLNPKNLTIQILKLRKKFSHHSVFVVMSPSQYLVIPIRFFLSNKIITDFGWSLYEGTKISRGITGIPAVKSYLIDFFAAHFSKYVVLESQEQAKFFATLFKIKRDKCRVVYTGLNERDFSPNSKFNTPKDIFSNSKIILFRGKYNPEGGLEVLAKTTKILESEDITFWVFTPNLPNSITFSKNTIIDRLYYSPDIIAKIQAACTISLGQLANHKRLSRTIPHKAFEAAYLGKPYITGRSQGILELFDEGTEIICFDPGNSNALAQAITQVLNNKSLAIMLGDNIKQKYNKQLTQAILANQFLKIIEESVS
jgi:glycosyltransferase involved in cell wall biosynthesis